MGEKQKLVFKKYDEESPVFDLSDKLRFTLFPEKEFKDHKYFGVVYFSGKIFNKTPWNFDKNEFFFLKDNKEVNDLINWLYNNLIFKS